LLARHVCNPNTLLKPTEICMARVKESIYLRSRNESS